MPALLCATLFSAGANLLYLTPTIYMMQVYDRVVPSASGGTLLLISLIGICGLFTLSLLDWLRSRLMVRVNARLERLLAPRILKAVLERHNISRVDRTEAIREFDTLRQTLTGGAMLALFDLPWVPVYVVASFLVHPLLALMTVIAAIILVTLAWANGRATHVPLERANSAVAIAYAKHSQISSYAAEVRAIGMCEALTIKAVGDRSESNRLQQEASFAAGAYGGLIKFFRLIFQSAALALGAWLAVDGKISMGSIIAASVLLSRALMPIEQVVGSWKQFTRVRSAHDALAAILVDSSPVHRTRLPALQGRIALERLTVRDTADTRDLLQDVNVTIEPGSIVGIAGHSGAGKSTLLRAIAGAIPLTSGEVRYDGAKLADWDGQEFARAIGYLPQDFLLFPGSIRDNISRFNAWLDRPAAEIDSGAVASAVSVGAHEMILRLPDGYNTIVGPGGTGLSAGQTQRIALARAVYGGPRVLLLDEPNAHLDAAGAAMLVTLIQSARAQGVTTVVAAHSAELLGACDRLLLVSDGRVSEHSPHNIRRARSPETVEA